MRRFLRLLVLPGAFLCGAEAQRRWSSYRTLNLNTALNIIDQSDELAAAIRDYYRPSEPPEELARELRSYNRRREDLRGHA